MVNTILNALLVMSSITLGNGNEKKKNKTVFHGWLSIVYKSRLKKKKNT